MLYVNHKGELYHDISFYRWHVCLPVDGIQATELQEYSVKMQDKDAVIVKERIRLDFFTDYAQTKHI